MARSRQQLYGRCNVSAWSNIVAMSAGGRHMVGLKADGKIVAASYSRDGQCGGQKLPLQIVADIL